MFNPNKINNQIIKNHNKKIKDIPDSKFFNVKFKPFIFSSRPMMQIIKKNGKNRRVNPLTPKINNKNFGMYNKTKK